MMVTCKDISPLYAAREDALEKSRVLDALNSVSINTFIHDLKKNASIELQGDGGGENHSVIAKGRNFTAFKFSRAEDGYFFAVENGFSAEGVY